MGDVMEKLIAKREKEALEKWRKNMKLKLLKRKRKRASV